MKRTAVMFLIFILIAGSSLCIKARINGCSSKGGICRKSQIKKCERLYEKCPTGRLCCKKDNSACGIKSQCRLRGGICVKGKGKLLDNGNLLRNGCATDSCQCIIPENTCACGIAKKTRVIGGKEIPIPNMYPWLVGIRKSSKRRYECGGTIINSRYVVTAAHCVRQGRKVISPKKLLIGVADHNYKSKEDDIKGVTKQVKIARITVHPKYRDALPGFDIALIRLTKELVFASEIAPACLPTGNRNYSNQNGIALGWGAVNNETFALSTVAREVTLPILPPNCNGIKVSSVKITKMMLCAGGKGGKDTCSGDSGGPLMVKEEGRFTLVGITSFGSGCAKEGLPAVYTRMSEYQNWIMRNTQDAAYCS
ncbi:clotting factor G beta subunit-like isoform X2 [Macrobrachium nipponense]|uniref:clotting factor G beta subunit-like isoform X2 n=1 Tax=Macrobrachium nipponense TaxID=159736 RepID=UPI0030C81556